MAVTVDLPPREGEGIADITAAVAAGIVEIDDHVQDVIADGGVLDTAVDQAVSEAVSTEVASSAAAPSGELYLATLAAIAEVDAAAAAAVSSVSVDASGALGDGTTDDTLAIRAAITAAGAGGVVRFTPGKTYLLSGQLTALTGQTWIGYGAKLKRCNAITTTTTGSISTGSSPTTVAVTSSASFRVGMHLIFWQSSSVYDTSSHIITAIPDATHVTVGTNFGTALSSGSNVSTGFEVVVSSVSRFRIVGIEIDDNRSNNTAFAKWQFHVAIAAVGNYNVVEGCYLHDCVSEGIELGGIASSARNNIIINCGGNGIHLSGSYGAQAINNYVKNTVILGTATDHADGAIIFSNTTGDSIIAGNYCDTSTCGIGSIDTDDNSSVTIANNTIRNMTVNAIEGVFPTATRGGKVTVTGNRIYDSIKVELNLTQSFDTAYGAYDWIFTGNYLENTTLSVTKSFGILIEGNTVTNATATTGIGITVSDCRHVSVQNNKVTGYANGIYCAGSNISGIKISGNLILNAYVGAINIQSEGTGRALSVEGNTIIVESTYTPSSACYGIQAANNWAVLNNVINMQATSTSHGIITGSGGSSANGTIVQGNVVRSSALTSSIRSSGGSQNNWVVNNFVQQAVSNAGGGSNTYSGNYTIY